MNQSERRAVLASTSDLRVLRESISNDIHRATPESLKRALESVNLLAQVVHELRTAAKAEPMHMSDVLTPPPELASEQVPYPFTRHQFELTAYDEDANDLEELSTVCTFNEALSKADDLAKTIDGVDQINVAVILSYKD